MTRITGQVDSIGAPYIFHPYHLAEQMTGGASVCAALLRHKSDPSRVGGVEVEGKVAKRRDRYLAALELWGAREAGVIKKDFS